MKYILGILAVIVIVVGLYMLGTKDTAAPTERASDDTTVAANDATQSTGVSEEREVVPEGTFVVVAEESVVNWAGKKPLIEGYINSGSLAVSEGEITVESDSASGSFTVDMNTLSVSETPTKPGAENTLESHLKGERWFNVAEYPTASFEIVEVTPRDDSAETFVYDVRGNLTMKGETGELSFPAEIYLGDDGLLHAVADFEFDRTKWGITSGSGSFFDGLADNVIDDMVALSFDLVAEPAPMAEPES